MAVLAPSLVRLRSELNQRWPHRDHTTDGWIGNADHKASGPPERGGSDHNENQRGVVDAEDIDVDGIDCPEVVARAIRHPSTHYVIWNRTIWTRESGFKPHRYTGSNPHTDHIHVSVIQSVAAENNTAPWGIAVGLVVVPVVYPTGGGGGDTTSTTWPTRLARALPTVRKAPPVRGSVRKLQALLNLGGAGLTVDGAFGQHTDTAVRAFQQHNGLGVDGVVGPNTWGKLLAALTTVRRGSTGTAAKQLQALLNLFGAGLTTDGVFGQHTATAVENFQRHYGLGADGIAGPITWTALLTR